MYTKVMAKSKAKMGRPLIGHQRLTPVSLRLEPDLVEAIDSYAATLKPSTRSEAIRRLVTLALKVERKGGQ
jgi:metal-responsive CopG/Arc/MetJ family transcriptional regulator